MEREMKIPMDGRGTPSVLWQASLGKVLGWQKLHMQIVKLHTARLRKV